MSASAGKPKFGKEGDFDLANIPTTDTEKYTVFDSPQGARKWFNNPKLSNYDTWKDGMSDSQEGAITKYVDGYYTEINSAQYGTPWEEMSNKEKELISNLHNGINGFDLNHGITINRQSDFQLFGASEGSKMTVNQIKDFLAQNGNVLQNDGFMSFSTDPNGHAIGTTGGLVIHLRVPPSQGACAYLGKFGLSSENEVLVNNNAVMRFDTESVTKDSNGKIHITADWLGQAKSQTISKTNTSVLKKNK